MNSTHDRIYFSGVREEVILRDNSACVECGMTREEHYIIYGRDITVDHIDGNGRNVLDKNNNINNLQTLCLGCHGRKDKSAKLTIEQAINIAHCRDNKSDMNILCDVYRVNRKAGYDISIGKSWSKFTGIHRYAKTPNEM